MSKKFYKLFFFAGAVFMAQNLMAQAIELPEVTTLVSGENEAAGTEHLPDFDDVLKLPNGSGNIEPELPELKESSEEDVVLSAQPVPEKTVYAEGFIGGGYPMLFAGNVSVFRSTGLSPFKLSFDYDSAAAYTNHSLTDNFSDKTTKLELNKAYKKNGLSLNAGGIYNTCEDGFQGNVLSNNERISLLNRNFYKAEASASYEFSNGFITGINADFDFYHRYAEQTCNVIPLAAYLELSPSVFAKWHGYGFEAGITADYTYSDVTAEYNGFEKGHRACFTINLQWENDFVKLYGDASAVIGNHLKNKPVIVPFTVGINAAIPVSFSDQNFEIIAEGGIASYRSGMQQLEEKFKFTCLEKNPTETSDWYGKLCLMLPVKEVFSASTSVEYRQTAYDNGIFEPDYKADVPALYSFYEREHKLLSSEIVLSYHHDNFKLSGGWQSNWLDLSALENKQTISLEFDYQDSDARWGVNASGKIGINEEIDVPVISAGGFIRILPSVKLSLSVNDIIKLVKSETRVYAGKYAARGGSATVLLKFFF